MSIYIDQQFQQLDVYIICSILLKNERGVHMLILRIIFNRLESRHILYKEDSEWRNEASIQCVCCQPSAYGGNNEQGRWTFDPIQEKKRKISTRSNKNITN